MKKKTKKRKKKVKMYSKENRIEKILIHATKTMHVVLAYSIAHSAMVLVDSITQVT